MPDYLIADNDRAYGKWLKPFLKEEFGVEVRHTPLFKPWFNCYAERMVRTFREELTDRVLIYNERDLHDLLRRYVIYYNECRAHSSIGSCVPLSREGVDRTGPIQQRAILDGLITDFRRAA